MPANALIQIDPDLKKCAAAVLEEREITVSDVVPILPTRAANEGALPCTRANNAAAHDVWFCAKAQEGMEDTRPPFAHEKVETHFAKRRAAAQYKVK